MRLVTNVMTLSLPRAQGRVSSNVLTLGGWLPYLLWLDHREEQRICSEDR